VFYAASDRHLGCDNTLLVVLLCSPGTADIMSLGSPVSISVRGTLFSYFIFIFIFIFLLFNIFTPTLGKVRFLGTLKYPGNRCSKISWTTVGPPSNNIPGGPCPHYN
jgi:hypothetical protein